MYGSELKQVGDVGSPEPRKGSSSRGSRFSCPPPVLAQLTPRSQGSAVCTSPHVQGQAYWLNR